MRTGWGVKGARIVVDISRKQLSLGYVQQECPFVIMSKKGMAQLANKLLFIPSYWQ